MRQNPWNAIITLGHANGTATMWSPNMSTPLVKMLCHRGPVSSLAFDMSGRYMATTGLDTQTHIWDVRKFKRLYSYKTKLPCASLDLSQRGLLSLGFGSHVEIWKDVFTRKQQEPYMRHELHGPAAHDLGFCPYDDVLGVGHESKRTSFSIGAELVW